MLISFLKNLNAKIGHGSLPRPKKALGGCEQSWGCEQTPPTHPQAGQLEVGLANLDKLQSDQPPPPTAGVGYCKSVSRGLAKALAVAHHLWPAPLQRDERHTAECSDAAHRPLHRPLVRHPCV